MSEQGAPKKAVRQFLEDAAPWKPAPYELHIVTALQALERGTADAYQQAEALKWIINIACRLYDDPYRTGSPDDTSFGLGRQFPGRQIVKLLKLNAAALRRNDPNADKGEPQS